VSEDQSHPASAESGSQGHESPATPAQSRKLERVGGKLLVSTPSFSVRNERFRHPDGGTLQRDLVVHPGSVGIVAHDGSNVFMVRQPRGAVSEADVLEIPAGTRDRERESALECAQRELAEEVSKAAGDWQELRTIYTSPGFTSEEVTLFMATELYEIEQPDRPEEHLEVVRFPFADLDYLIESCRDAKSVIGLSILRERVQAPGREAWRGDTPA
jgi:ADP-ribose pyrophosphatase